LALKAQGPVLRTQALLADLYPAANADERYAILWTWGILGVEGAVKALPQVVEDYAAARPKHPNPMSFASHRVLRRFIGLAFQKLPREDGFHLDQRPKDPDARAGQKPTRSSPDGLVHCGSRADREAIRRVVVAKKLHEDEGAGKDPY